MNAATYATGSRRRAFRCRTASGSVYTIDPQGNVSGAHTGVLVRAHGHRAATPEVGGRLAIVEDDALVLTSPIVEVAVAAA